MADNQTIDGVPRELLLDIEYWLKHMEAEKSIEGRCSALKELRDLLDAPAQEQQWINIEAFNRVSTELEELKAAQPQPQGEPVAWQHRVTAGPQTGWSLWAPGKGKEWAEHYTVEVRPLYAEQPATVKK